MLNEFLLWWARELRAAVPARLLPSGAALDARGLVLSLRLPADALPAVDVTVRRKGRDGTLGSFTLDAAGVPALRAAVAGQGPGVVLRLPPGVMLEQSVALPLAAERDPERVLQYEMDRVTPFTADDLFWTWWIDRRDRANGRLHVRLALVPRARLASVIDALHGAGLRPTAFETADPARRIAVERPRTASRRGLAFAAAACAVLAFVAAAVPFEVQSVRGARIERRIAALRPQVDQAEALRRRILASAAGQDVFADQRARSGDALGTLALLTDVLPDDTFLNELTMRARVVTLSGLSAGAARLIAALAAEPGIRNPAFAAPVTRGEGTRNEGFSIRAEVAP